MMRYAVYLCTADDTYRDLEQTFEVSSPREAAQRAFEQLDLHPDEEFPQVLVVPDDQVNVFTRDDLGRAVTTGEDLMRAIAKGPQSAIVTFEAAQLREQP